MLSLVGIRQSVYVHHLHCIPPSLFPDNELADCVMVMLANNKALLQVNSDLRLFLGDNTDRLVCLCNNSFYVEHCV